MVLSVGPRTGPLPCCGVTVTYGGRSLGFGESWTPHWADMEVPSEALGVGPVLTPLSSSWRSAFSHHETGTPLLLALESTLALDTSASASVRWETQGASPPAPAGGTREKLRY